MAFNKSRISARSDMHVSANKQGKHLRTSLNNENGDEIFDDIEEAAQYANLGRRTNLLG